MPLNPKNNSESNLHVPIINTLDNYKSILTIVPNSQYDKNGINLKFKITKTYIPFQYNKYFFYEIFQDIPISMNIYVISLNYTLLKDYQDNHIHFKIENQHKKITVSVLSLQAFMLHFLTNYEDLLNHGESIVFIFSGFTLDIIRNIFSMMNFNLHSGSSSKRHFLNHNDKTLTMFLYFTNFINYYNNSCFTQNLRKFNNSPV